MRTITLVTLDNSSPKANAKLVLIPVPAEFESISPENLENLLLKYCRIADAIVIDADKEKSFPRIGSVLRTIASTFSISIYNSVTEAEEKVDPYRRTIFDAAQDRVFMIHKKKSHDYGSHEDPFYNVRMTKEWGIPPWVGALIRAGDKVTRLQQFVKKGKLVNESVEDSLIDLATYATIALALYLEEQ